MPPGRFPIDQFPARLQWDDAAWEWQSNADATSSIVIKRFAANGDCRGNDHGLVG